MRSREDGAPRVEVPVGPDRANEVFSVGVRRR
jgi:hypothetical protein